MEAATEKQKVDRKTALITFAAGLYWDTLCFQMSEEQYNVVGQDFYLKATALFLKSIDSSAAEFETVFRDFFARSYEQVVASEDTAGIHNIQYLIDNVLPSFLRMLDQAFEQFEYDFTPQPLIQTH